MLILLTVIMMETPKMRYVNSLSFMMTKITKCWWRRGPNDWWRVPHLKGPTTLEPATRNLSRGEESCLRKLAKPIRGWWGTNIYNNNDTFSPYFVLHVLKLHPQKETHTPTICLLCAIICSLHSRVSLIIIAITTDQEMAISVRHLWCSVPTQSIQRNTEMMRI